MFNIKKIYLRAFFVPIITILNIYNICIIKKVGLLDILTLFLQINCFIYYISPLTYNEGKPIIRVFAGFLKISKNKGWVRRVGFKNSILIYFIISH